MEFGFLKEQNLILKTLKKSHEQQIQNSKTTRNRKKRFLFENSPSVTYLWTGQSYGKGQFLLKNSQNNELIFSCKVEKWKNKKPQGYIQLIRVNKISLSKYTNSYKQTQKYSGNVANGMREGYGEYSVIQNNDNDDLMRKIVMEGFWKQDILYNGEIVDDQNNKILIKEVNEIQAQKAKLQQKI